MSAQEAWRRKQNEDQFIYFVFCLLGGVHGIGMQDVFATISAEANLAEALRQRLRQSIETERDFLTTTRFLQSSIALRLGSAVALERSGLEGFWKISKLAKLRSRAPPGASEERSGKKTEDRR